MRRITVLLFAVVVVVCVAILPGSGLEAASVAYTYDGLGRVRTARYDNGVCIVYAYDASGNRTSQTNTSAGAPVTPTWGTGVFGCFYWTP